MQSFLSLRSQVIHSFHLYEKMIQSKHGEDFLWLLYPQDSVLFDEFIKHKPDPKYLNYVYKNKKYSELFLSEGIKLVR